MIFESRLISSILVIVIIGLIGWTALYVIDFESKIYIENSIINAPIISLAPTIPGSIDKVFVGVGDSVSKGQRVATVGGQEIDAQTFGIVTMVNNAPGQLANAQTPVVQMYDPTALRVQGHIEEDKGLSDIRVGQKVIFTVDAFGSKQFEGVVDYIGQTARTQDIVFNISDKRQENQFDVGVTFSSSTYPELKNGMSAKMWVIK